MEFRTEIKAVPSPFRIDHQSKILFSGSCFTANIGSFLEEHLFPVKINPFGVVYNPISILNTLGILIDEEKYSPDELEFANDKWFSWDHHTSFSDPDRETCLARINTALSDASSHLKDSKYLILTFGTAWVFSLRESGKIVTNCHKMPDSRFERFLLRKEDIVHSWTSFLKELFTINPGLKVIFTISPVRHTKDGAHGNQVSKAVLMLAVEEIISAFPGTAEYFPAYELLLDDLRDYRFYSDDLVHPSPQAISYILEKFSQTYFDQSTNDLIKEIHKLVLAAGHRTFNPGTPAHKKFIASIKEMVKSLVERHPELDPGRFGAVIGDR